MLGTIIGYLDGIPLVTYDRIEIDPEELSTDGISDGNLGGLLLSYRHVSVYGNPLGTNLDTKLWLWYGEMLGTTLLDLWKY